MKELTKEAKSSEEFVKERKKADFLYHTTFSKNLSSIKKYGLKPQNGRRIWFSQDAKSVLGWGNKCDPVFRIHRANIGNLKSNIGAYNTAATKESISPRLIEVSLDSGKSWKPLLTKATARAEKPAEVERDKLSLVKKYVEQTGEKIETEADMAKVKEMFPNEWGKITKEEKYKKSLWKKLPKDFRANRGINEYAAPELEKMVTKPIPREPWQMTKEELKTYNKGKLKIAEKEGKDIYFHKNLYPTDDYSLKRIHKESVSQAIKEGKPIPKEVLAEYPGLNKKVTAKGKKPAVQKELKLLVKEAEIREWQDIPELDAQIRTIKEPDPKDKDDIFWTIKIGLQESLGEQGGDIITEFYKGEPTLKDIKRDIINTYKEKKIEINKEVAIGITAKSGRDEMIEEVIDKILGKQTLTR